MSTPADARSAGPPLGIICGGGSLPLVVAQAVKRHGGSVLLFPVRGWADPASFAGLQVHWIGVGQFGRIIRVARQHGCTELVMIGTALRPAISQLRFDWVTLRMLPSVFAAFCGGDDHLLRAVGRVFEQHGFRLRGAHEIAPDILMPPGPLGGRRPSAAEEADIAHGLDLLQAIGRFDVGQAVVVAGKRVLAVEAADGTDLMLEHVARLREAGRIRTRGGVLVKAPKPGQDHRFDLPSVGPRTVDGAAKAGLAGIAALAGATVIAEPQAVAAAANAAGIFVVGIEAQGGYPHNR